MVYAFYAVPGFSWDEFCSTYHAGRGMVVMPALVAVRGFVIKEPWVKAIGNCIETKVSHWS